MLGIPLTDPDRLDAFRRGWIVIAVFAVLAALASLPLPRRRTLAATVTAAR